MCGIGFASLTEHSDLDPTVLARALLVALEVRGKHASGAAWHVGPDGEAPGVYYAKAPERASVWAPTLTIDRDARAIIVHTRFATLGDPQFNENNHPIIRPGIALVHNGVVYNHAQVFALLGAERHAEVDSEAIAAAIIDSDTGTAVADRLKLIDGSAACAWLRPGHAEPTVYVARIAKSPIIVGTTRDGDTFGASTNAALDAVERVAGVRMVVRREFRERTWMSLRYGQTLRHRGWSGAESTAAPTADQAAREAAALAQDHGEQGTLALEPRSADGRVLVTYPPEGRPPMVRRDAWTGRIDRMEADLRKWGK